MVSIGSVRNEYLVCIIIPYPLEHYKLLDLDCHASQSEGIVILMFDPHIS